jgi:hypothetical protein
MQIFHAEHCKRMFFDLIQANAFGQNRNAEAARDQILDRRQVIDFQYDVELVYRHAFALEMRDEEIAHAGIRKAQMIFSFLSSLSVT